MIIGWHKARDWNSECFLRRQHSDGPMTIEKATGATNLRRRLFSHSMSNAGWWFLAISLFGLLAAGILLDAMNHDVAWYVFCAGRVLDGAELYRDIVDTNPPLVVYMCIPAVLLGRLTSWPATFVFNLCLIALVGLCLLICRRILEEVLAKTSATGKKCILLVLVCILLPSAGFGSFGNREHIMLLLTMPYILLASGGPRGLAIAVHYRLFIGMLAGLGLALKPYFLLLWVLVEGYILISEGKAGMLRRVENIGILIVLMTYAATVVVSTPAYYRQVIPMAMRVYSAYDCSAVFLLKHSVTKLWMGGLLAFAFMRPTRENRDIRRILMIAATGFLIIAFVQHKGWNYHFYPAKGVSLLLLCVLALGLIERPEALGELIRPGKTLVVVLVIFSLFYRAGTQVASAANGENRELLTSLVDIVNRHAEKDAILLLSTAAYPQFPLVNYTGVEWSSRFNCLWLLPGSYMGADPSEKRIRYHRPDEMGEIERFFFEAMVQDIGRRPPALVIVSTKDGIGRRVFDYIGYLKQEPCFAEIWTKYEFLTTVDHFKVYKRTGDGPRRDSSGY
jgi:hypothetical protein